MPNPPPGRPGPPGMSLNLQMKQQLVMTPRIRRKPFTEEERARLRDMRGNRRFVFREESSD